MVLNKKGQAPQTSYVWVKN